MKNSSFFAEEEIVFEEDEICIITEANCAGRIFIIIIILISIPFYVFLYFVIASVSFFVNPPFSYILLVAFLFFMIYWLDYFIKNRHHFFYEKIKINKISCHLEIIDKLETVVKKVDFFNFQYISLQYVSYGGGRSPFVSIVLIGDKSEMSIKKISFDTTQAEAFKSAYQWSLPLSKFLGIPIKNDM